MRGLIQSPRWWNWQSRQSQELVPKGVRVRVSLWVLKIQQVQSVIKAVNPTPAPVVESVDTRDLKSLSQLGVRVRVSPGVQHFGVLAQRQSSWLLTNWSQVRSLETPLILVRQLRLVEHRCEVPGVAGSIPVRTTSFRRLAQLVQSILFTPKRSVVRIYQGVLKTIKKSLEKFGFLELFLYL